MNDPLVTVLMTVYNGENYLKAAVQSVLDQSFKDFEFLIINDCSTDNSPDVIRNFNDSRIRLIDNEMNIGQTRSLNKGLSLAKGRYLARMDADDLAFPAWLEKNLNLLKSLPQTALVSCKALVIDGANKAQKILNTPTEWEEMVLRSLTASPVNHVGAVFKTDVILSVGGYDETLKIAADFELWSRLIRKNIQLATNDEVLVAIRVHEKSASVLEKGRVDFVEISTVMKKNFEVLTGLEMSDQDIALLWRLNYATHELNDGEFKQGLELLLDACQRIKPEFIISFSLARSYASQQRNVLSFKRCLHLIQDGRIRETRLLIADFYKAGGQLGILNLIWLGSFLGKPVMNLVPAVYNFARKEAARREIPENLFVELV